MDICHEINENNNLLPEGGTANYLGKILSPEKAQQYFELLKNTIPWKPDEVFLFGKHIITKRKTAWYGDKSYEYTYSNSTKKALPWTKEVLELKKIVQQKTGNKFNSCLLNLYHTGEEGMSWHSDNEKPLGKHPVIASLSIGATRKFSLKHKITKQKISFFLENGSLLVMKGEIQENWQHSLPKTKRIQQPRINLTFRRMVSNK